MAVATGLGDARLARAARARPGAEACEPTPSKGYARLPLRARTTAWPSPISGSCTVPAGRPWRVIAAIAMRIHTPKVVSRDAPTASLPGAVVALFGAQR